MNTQTQPVRTGMVMSLATLGVTAAAFAAGPTPHEQYMIQIVNRARADPLAEVARRGLSDLNEGLAPGTISSAAKPPLAVNATLTTIARDYNQLLLTGAASGHGDVGGRLDAGGYNWIAYAENLGAASSPTVTTAAMDTIQQLLFVDVVDAGRGHRLNLMNPNLKEIGVGAGALNGTVQVTEDFGNRSGDSSFYITGAVYTDAVTADNFYTPGEGISEATITATNTANAGQVFTVATMTAGGYSLAVPAGTYAITVSGGGIAAPVSGGTVIVGGANVAVNVVATAIPEPTSLAAVGLAATAGLRRRRA